MREITIWIGLTFFSLGCIGCTDVANDAPLISDSARDIERRLAGEWQSGKGPAVVFLAKEGIIIGLMQYNDSDNNVVALNFRMHLTRIRDCLLAFVKLPDSKNYTVLYVNEFTDDHVQIRRPDDRVFESLVASGILKGSINDSKSVVTSLLKPRIFLSSDASGFASAIDSKSIDSLFPPSRAITFYRSSAPKGPGLESN